MYAADSTGIDLMPFCDCMHKDDFEGGKPADSVSLHWRPEEYDVLSSEQVYAEVAAHRRACRVESDLFERVSEEP